MNVHPNQTQVKAVVKQVAPCEDGVGHELDLEVLANESPDPAADFLRPHSGDRLKVFTARLDDLEEGQQIQATVGLAGGPFQERAVLRKAEKLPVKP
jgi:hypothetical protein